MKIDLSVMRGEILEVFKHRRDTGGPRGCYRWLPGSRTNLYASLDAAISYCVMGIESSSLEDTDRLTWIDHINSYADDVAGDGRYKDVIPRHSYSHANGMVIGALGYLGGKQLFPVTFYSDFDTPEKIVRWLENVDWPRQWASGFWGGPMMFSTSKGCSPEWIDAAVGWLDENLDPGTGMWRIGVEPENKYHPLGGFVHIYPIYELHGRSFRYPERVIDSVYGLQMDDGRWYDGDAFSYLDMDALYAYAAMLKHTDKKVDLVYDSALRYGRHLMALLSKKDIYDTITMHGMLCLASTLGLLNQLLPEIFFDTVRWLDIFSARMLYRTYMVETD